MTHNDGAELVKRIGSACFKADRFRKRQVSATAHQLGMIPLPMHILNIDGFSPVRAPVPDRSEEHTSELQSLMRIPYAVFCLKKKIKTSHTLTSHHYFQHLNLSRHPTSN